MSPKSPDPYKNNPDKVRARMKADEGDTRWWKPKRPGLYIVRFLPPWGPEADNTFFYPVGLHYGVKIGGQNRAVPCQKTNVPKKRCIVCEFREGLSVVDNEDLKDISNKLRLKKKYFVNLIDRKQPDKVKIYGGSKKMVKAVEDTYGDDDYNEVTDPTEGHDVKCRRTGTTFSDTEYTWTVRPKPTPLGLDDWKSQLHQLHEGVVEWMTLPEVARVMRDNFKDAMDEIGFKLTTKETTADEDDDDDEEDSKPKKKPQKPPKDEDEDESEEEEDEDQEEDDEEEDED